MYSKASWGGSIDPYISATFENSSSDPESDTVVSFVLFEWRDEYLLGVADPQSDSGAVRSPKSAALAIRKLMRPAEGDHLR